MWVTVGMNVLWGNCSVLCRMYEGGEAVAREGLCQPGISKALRLGFQTRVMQTTSRLSVKL